MATSIGTAWIQIKPSLKGVSNDIKKALGQGSETIGPEFGNKFKSSFLPTAKSAFSEAFTEFGKRSDAAWADFKAKASAAGLALGGGLVYAIKQFAEYEQLIGGVDTLFKQHSKEVQAYASQAYKTAQLSANKYMSTITSFSASLLQGLKGDTAAAAKIGNMAVIDMADNANKMGTSMESIQYAYQGFAKQNYTMLDNLKLGYGGTASEMARLIKNSGVMGKEFKATAENMKNVPFHKVVEAIHKIQEEMGIAGTSSKEASQTISGSFNSAKAAFEDMLVALADPNGDFEGALGRFVESARTFIGNVLPIIKQVAVTAFQEIEKQWPGLAATIRDVSDNVKAALNWASENKDLVLTIGKAAVAFKTLQIATGGVRSAMDTLRPYNNIVKGVFRVFKKDENGVSQFTAFLKSDFVQSTSKAVASAVTSAVTVSGAWIASATSTAAAWIAANAAMLGLWGLAIAAVVGAVALIIANWDGIKEFFGGLWNGIVEVFNAAPGFFSDVFRSAWEAVKGVFSGVGGFFRQVWNDIVSVFGSVGTAVGNAIGGAVKGVVNSILGFAENTINGFIRAINHAIGAINKIPGVNIGRLNTLNIPRLATGGPVFGGGGPMSDKVPAMLSNGEYVIRAAAARKIGYSALNDINRSGETGGSVIHQVFNINGYNKDPRELADEISRIIALRAKGVVG